MITQPPIRGALDTEPDDLSGHRHRKFIGFFGLLLPILLWLIAAWRPTDEAARWKLLNSVSAYYHSGAVVVFVGILITLAVFLFSYRGFDNEDRRRDRGAALIAGVAATLVALFPTDVPPGVPRPVWWADWMGTTHYVSAAILFLSFIFFSLVLFRKSNVKERKERSRGKRWRDGFYIACGIVMVVCLLWTGIAASKNAPIFWPEALALVFFALSWLVKGRVDLLAGAMGRGIRHYGRHPGTLTRDVWSAIRRRTAHPERPATRDYPADLSSTVTRAARSLRSMSATKAQARRSPTKWSAQEIIGHLIDSASNNHQRFVRAQFRDDLRFEGYAQDDWVRAQDYQSASWAELIALWEALNLHLARVMECVPEPARRRPRADHNLDLIAWETVPQGEIATLDYFMRDYVGHLKHHLRQIDEGLATAPASQRT